MQVRNVLIVIEVILLIIFLLPILSNIINPGNIAGILFSIALLVITLFSGRFFGFLSFLRGRLWGKILMGISAAVIGAGAVYVLVITAFIVSAAFDGPENPQAVIVLGCKVNGDRPSRMLRRRLDSAAEFLTENGGVICVVSGGKGDDEDVSEAQAMKSYLIDKGIAPERIVSEDKSVNTYENIHNSIGILGINSGEVAIVTDGFHQYRAGRIAKKAGLRASAVNAVTDMRSISLVPTYYIRELMAITNEYIRH